MSRPPSRTVFVGNIPYTKTEEQITEIFQNVGRVLNFRLVYDKETGRPKGFGFAEFADPDTAASAVRNLNNLEIDGRKLRVDFSNENAAGGDDDDRDNRRNNDMSSRAPFPSHHPSNGSGPSGPNQDHPTTSSSLPNNLPPGRDLPPGVSCTDAISQTLHTLAPLQLIDFIRAMKEMATSDTDRAVELLTQAPQLGYAVFQALLQMKLVQPDVLHSIIDPSSAPPRGPPPPQQMYAQPQMNAPAYGGGGYPGPVGATNTPPVPVGGFGAPPAAVAPAAQPDTEQLFAAVLQLTEDQINQLPPAEREQIKAIRASLGVGA